MANNRIMTDREGALRRMLGNDLSAHGGQGIRNRDSRTPHRLIFHIRSREGLRTEDCLDADLIRAGRDPSNNIVVSSRYWSRRQFEIFTKNDGYYIRNLSRTNPTILIRGGRRIPMGDRVWKLSDGDQLRVGDIRLETGILWEKSREDAAWE